MYQLLSLTRLHAPLIDGEAVITDSQGVASFDLLRGRAREKHAFVWAFDLLELDSKNLRHLPLERRKDELTALLKHASFGLALNDYVAGDGPHYSPRHAPWSRGRRVEAAELALPVGALAGLA